MPHAHAIESWSPRSPAGTAVSTCATTPLPNRIRIIVPANSAISWPTSDGSAGSTGVVSELVIEPASRPLRRGAVRRRVADARSAGEVRQRKPFDDVERCGSHGLRSTCAPADPVRRTRRRAPPVARFGGATAGPGGAGRRAGPAPPDRPRHPAHAARGGPGRPGAGHRPLPAGRGAEPARDAVGPPRPARARDELGGRAGVGHRLRGVPRGAGGRRRRRRAPRVPAGRDAAATADERRAAAARHRLGPVPAGVRAGVGARPGASWSATRGAP